MESKMRVMDKLIDLSKKIEDDNLRKMVVDFLKNPTPSNKYFKDYPRMEIEKAVTPFSMGPNAMPVKRDVLNHTIALTESCEMMSGILKNNYGIDLDKDNLIAAALLHDIMKIFQWEDTPKGLKHTGIMLDHTMLITSELYSRGFPEEIIHIVASHFGETGPTPPMNFEAVLLHKLDNMLSLIEYSALEHSSQAEQAIKMILMDDASLKDFGEEIDK